MTQGNWMVPVMSLITGIWGNFTTPNTMSTSGAVTVETTTVSLDETPLYVLELCQFDGGVRNCNTQTTTRGMKMPDNYCARGVNCDACVLGWETKVVLLDNTLSTPIELMYRQEAHEQGTGRMYSCKQQGIHECACTPLQPCSGDISYCKEQPCDPSNPCKCQIVKAITRVVMSHQTGNITDGFLVSYRVCLYNATEYYRPRVQNGANVSNVIPQNLRRARHHHLHDRRKRSLLSVDEGEFSSVRGSIKFKSPILTVDNAGALIIRKGGLEWATKIEDQNSTQVVVPEEYLLTSGQMHVILVKKNGVIIEADFSIEGKTFCARLDCILCWKAIYFAHCMPSELVYLGYAISLITFGIVLWYIKVILITIWQGLRVLILAGYLTYWATRGTVRGSMILGYIVGDRIRDLAIRAHNGLERAALQAQRPQQLAIAMALILFATSILTPVEGGCTEHRMIQSAARECVRDAHGTECKISQQLQVTLTNLKYSICLWFLDESENAIFQMMLEFKDVDCLWHNELNYFTFPTELRVLTQVACAQNSYCNWGIFCKRNYRFEALTREAESYSGSLNCRSGKTTSGCIIVTSDPCFHYKYYFVPEHEKTYSVSKVKGAHCQAAIELSIHKNGSIEKHIIKRQGNYNGIVVTPLGNLDQNIELVDRHLITRVNNPSESYLDSASEPHRPEYGKIGDVQSGVVYSNTFAFDQNAVQCDLFEARLTCEKPESYLTKMTTEKINLLPLVWMNHRLFIDSDRQLRSTLIQSAPVIVHLSFSGYKVHVAHSLVCPHIERIVSTKGCFNCKAMAELVLEAKSTCLPGVVSVEFMDIPISTRSVYLETSVTQVTISFKLDRECAKERVCLVTRSAKSCEAWSFCLDAPVVSIESAGIASASAKGTFSPGEWPAFWQIFGIFAGLSGTVRLISMLVAGGLLTAFVISICMTVCFRRT